MYAKAIEIRERAPLPLLLAPLFSGADEACAPHTAGWRPFGGDALLF